MQKRLEEERNQECGSTKNDASAKTINDLEDRIKNLQKLVINNGNTQYTAPKVNRRQTVCLSSLGRQNEFARPFPVQKPITRQDVGPIDDDFPDENSISALDRIDQEEELRQLQQIGNSFRAITYTV